MNLEKRTILSKFEYAKEKSLSCGDTTIFSYSNTIEYSSSLLSIINSSNLKNKTKVYWSQPSKHYKFLSIGETISINLEQKNEKLIEKL